MQINYSSFPKTTHETWVRSPTLIAKMWNKKRRFSHFFGLKHHETTCYFFFPITYLQIYLYIFIMMNYSGNGNPIFQEITPKRTLQWQNKYTQGLYNNKYPEDRDDHGERRNDEDVLWRTHIVYYAIHFAGWRGKSPSISLLHSGSTVHRVYIIPIHCPYQNDFPIISSSFGTAKVVYGIGMEWILCYESTQALIYSYPWELKANLGCHYIQFKEIHYLIENQVRRKDNLKKDSFWWEGTLRTSWSLIWRYFLYFFFVGTVE